jgi:hypothetical protein
MPFICSDNLKGVICNGSHFVVYNFKNKNDVKTLYTEENVKYAAPFIGSFGILCG